FYLAGAGPVGARHLDMLKAALRRGLSLVCTMLLPGQIVEGSRRIGDAPMHKGAAGVGFQRLLETLDTFLMIETVAPVQADIEPALGLRRSGGDRAPIGAEVEAIHPCFLPMPCLQAGHPRLASASSWLAGICSADRVTLPSSPCAARGARPRRSL